MLVEGGTQIYTHTKLLSVCTSTNRALTRLGLLPESNRIVSVVGGWQG
jgi:hypothetical protein